MEIRITFSLTSEDFQQYYLYTGWSAPSKSSFRKKYYLRMVVANLLILAATYVGVLRKTDYGWWIVGIFILVVILQALYTRRSYKNQALDELRTHKEYLSESTLTFSESGIHQIFQQQSYQYKWEDIVRSEENEEYFFLFTGERSFVIPKRVLDAQQLKDLSVLLSRNVPLEAELGHMIKNN